MEGTGLGGFVGYGGAGFGVHGFSNGVQVQSLFTYLLKEMGGEDRLCDTPGRNEPAKFAMAEGSGGEVGCPVVRK